MSTGNHLNPRPTRRTLLMTGAAATAASALGTWAIPSAMARNLRAQTFGSTIYDNALKVDGGIKGVFQSPYYNATLVSGKHLNHLILLQLKNWLNSFQFAYKMPAEDLHTIVATYASANILTYGDAIWEKYKLGEKYEIVDPATGNPAIRNLFWEARFGPDAPKDITAKDNYYQDTGIQVLQERGAVFLSCNNSMGGHAAAAVSDGRAPAGMEAQDVAADIAANLVPNATLVPAVVGEVSRAQAAGYSLVFIPNFPL